jgi:hypothetical protein
VHLYKQFYSNLKLLFKPMFVEGQVGIPDVHKNDVIWGGGGGQASWPKMMSSWGKLIALACHPTKKVSKAE